MPTIQHGTCIDCGNAEHECECAEREKAARVDKVEEYLLSIVEQLEPGRTGFNPYKCFDCLLHADNFMLFQEIWNTAWPTYTADRAMIHARFATMYPEFIKDAEKPGRVRRPFAGLCFQCLEKRLNRTLTLADFPRVPANSTIRFAFAMGQQDLISNTLARESHNKAPGVPKDEELLELAQRFVSIMTDAHPGLASWMIARNSLAVQLRDAPQKKTAD